MKNIKFLFIFSAVFVLLNGCNLKVTTDKTEAKPANTWTTLHITNDSSKILKDMAYSGGRVYYNEGGVLSNLTDLKPGQSCTVKIADKNGDGFIHFTVGGKSVRTQNRYTIQSGEESNVTVTDNTPVIFEGALCLLHSL